MPKIVEDGDTVKVHYTGWKTNGEQFDTSKGKDALTVTIGRREVIEGFNNAIIGMEIGEIKKVTIPKELAYGEKSPI
jgi:peptidylprolyl isomerase